MIAKLIKSDIQITQRRPLCEIIFYTRKNISLYILYVHILYKV